MISLQKEMQEEFRGYWTEAVKPTVKTVDRASTMSVIGFWKTRMKLIWVTPAFFLVPDKNSMHSYILNEWVI